MSQMNELKLTFDLSGRMTLTLNKEGGAEIHVADWDEMWLDMDRSQLVLLRDWLNKVVQ